jgi:hypothetical protein
VVLGDLNGRIDAPRPGNRPSFIAKPIPALAGMPCGEHACGPVRLGVSWMAGVLSSARALRAPSTLRAAPLGPRPAFSFRMADNNAKPVQGLHSCMMFTVGTQSLLASVPTLCSNVGTDREAD